MYPQEVDVDGVVILLIDGLCDSSSFYSFQSKWVMHAKRLQGVLCRVKGKWTEVYGSQA